MNRYHVVSLVLVIGLTTVSASAITTIDTSGLWPGNTGLSFGHTPYVATMGQTFTVPADNVLNSFTFYTYQTSPTLQFKAYVMAWDGTSPNFLATGSPLYASNLVTGLSYPGIQTLVFVPAGGLTLTPGQQSVAFLSTSDTGYTGPGSGSAMLGVNLLAGDTYPGGELVLSSSGGDSSLWTAANWSPLGAFDTAFGLSFSSPISIVPEPLSVIGVLGGLGALGAYLRRRTTGPIAARKHTVEHQRACGTSDYGNLL